MGGLDRLTIEELLATGQTLESAWRVSCAPETPGEPAGFACYRRLAEKGLAAMVAVVMAELDRRAAGTGADRGAAALARLPTSTMMRQ